jgi:hypothetical protein
MKILDFSSPAPKVPEKSASSTRKSYEEKKSRSQRLEEQKIIEIAGGNVKMLLKAGEKCGKLQGDLLLSKNIKNLIANIDNQGEVSLPDALNFHLDNKFSKIQYCNTRRFMSESGYDLMPSYKELIRQKKLCYPNEITVTETIAEVKLQAFHDHTAQRILQCSKDGINGIKKDETSKLELTLMYSWGFDGSSGHSNYNMKFRDNGSDGSLFATTAIPLKLFSRSLGTVWKNPSSASSRFVRPLRLEFIKESKEVILNTKCNIQQQIDNLRSFKTTCEGMEIEVKAEFFLTLIDGKCLSIITGQYRSLFKECVRVNCSLKNIKTFMILEQFTLATKF